MLLVKKVIIKENKENKDSVNLQFQCIDTQGNEQYIEKELTNETFVFSMGCYRVKVRKYLKEKEIKRLEKLINYSKNKIYSKDTMKIKEEFIKYLNAKREKVKNAGNIKELSMEYSKCTIKIESKQEKTKIDIEDKKEIIFSNLEIAIFKN